MYNQFSQFPQPMPPMQPYPQMRQYPTAVRQEVTRVNGYGGANAYQLFPNSSALLLDETEPIVWLVTTDGAGYKSINPYKIEPYMEKAPVDPDSLEKRVSRLEEILNGKSHDATSAAGAAAEHTATVPAIQTGNDGQGPAGNGYGPSQQRKNESATV